MQITRLPDLQNILRFEIGGRIITEQFDHQNLPEDFDVLDDVSSPKVILDLEKIDFINSSGLNLLIHILTKVRNLGGEVVICNIPERVNKLLVITKLNHIFTIRDIAQEAEKFFENYE